MQRLCLFNGTPLEEARTVPEALEWQKPQIGVLPDGFRNYLGAARNFATCDVERFGFHRFILALTR